MIGAGTMYDEFGNPVEGEEEDAVGGLAAYSDPNVQKYMTDINKLAAEQKARYDAQAKALAEKRYGPSFSERMFQLAGALAEPTKTGFSGVLGNVAPVLAGQMQAKRQGELSRREALEQLNKDQLEQQMGLAKQGLSTSLAMAKIKNQRPPSEFSYQLDPSGVVREVPKKVYRPKNEAEYASIPIGQYYAVPSGPDAGKVLVKR